jgi:hypothetical protein
MKRLFIIMFSLVLTLVMVAPVMAQEDTTNLALNKSTLQSSTDYGGSSDRAVDGNTDGIYWSNSVTHTYAQTSPWWQVDLGVSQDISKVEIWNRTDCCAERLNNFYVFVSDTPFTSNDPAVTASQENVEAYFISGAAPTSSEIDVNAQGRYVRVQLQGYGILSLAEVKVLKLNDIVAPTLSISVDKPVLSKPNHKMNAVQVTLNGSDDNGSGVKSIVLTSITSNEDDNGLGDGNTSEDIQGAEFGTEDTSFLLRAERSGKGTGRVYTITYTITDNAGNASTASTTITVPKGKK